MRFEGNYYIPSRLVKEKLQKIILSFLQSEWVKIGSKVEERGSGQGFYEF
jgi:hypothetical protein